MEQLKAETEERELEVMETSSGSCSTGQARHSPGPGKKESYGSFLYDVRKEFNEKVLTVQKKAETDTNVFQKYCEELQANMRLLEQEVLQLRQGAGQDTTAVSRENSQPLLELLEHMTGLSVSSLQDSADSHKYMCTVVDGALRGHKFILTLDRKTKEYTYDPQDEVRNNLTNDSETVLISFPQHMLSRFLLNLLSSTYSMDS